MPPLRISAPNGAPTKNKIMQESPKANLSCSATRCLLMFT